MNVSTTSFSPTQMILAWTLLVLLLSWFILFTALALRDYFMKKVEWEDLATPSRPIPSDWRTTKRGTSQFCRDG